MSTCISGHENPAGAAYCTTCGKDLSLKAPILGRQCIHGHPMSSLDKTCPTCGNIPVLDPIKPAPSGTSVNKSGILAKLELTDMQEDARKFLRKVKTKSNINLKVVFLVLVLVITIPSAYFGYTLYAGPNYKGKTVEEVFKNREDKIAAVLAPACSIGTNEISEAEAEITSTAGLIEADYRYALRFAIKFGFSSKSDADVPGKIRDEVERQLKSALGDNYSKLDNATSVITSGEDSAIAFCGLGSAMTGIQTKSTALDQIIEGINSPGYWAGSGYTYSIDPNMAWKWAPRSSYPDGGWAVLVVSRLGCPGGVVVELDATYGNYTGRAGRVSMQKESPTKVNIISNYPSLAGTETGSFEQVTCLR